jgi:hypothetical protein
MSGRGQWPIAFALRRAARDALDPAFSTGKLLRLVGLPCPDVAISYSPSFPAGLAVSSLARRT